MSSTGRMQENRFELKYIIDEPTAHGVRDFARCYLEPDEYANPAKCWSYNIHSIYLDNAPLDLYRSTLHGHKNRYKLRIRYYDDNPSHPIFFEIKRRVADAILKRRAVVRRDAVLSLIDGQCPTAADLVNPHDLKSLDAIHQFWEIASRIQAQPQVIVSYNREAWVTTENNSIRLTFDRGLTATPWTRKLVCPDVSGPGLPTVGGVVLELKFTDRFPRWMHDLCQTFNLYRFCMAKYVHCINATRMSRLLSPIEDIEGAYE